MYRNNSTITYAKGAYLTVHVCTERTYQYLNFYSGKVVAATSCLSIGQVKEQARRLYWVLTWNKRFPMFNNNLTVQPLFSSIVSQYKHAGINRASARHVCDCQNAMTFRSWIQSQTFLNVSYSGNNISFTSLGQHLRWMATLRLDHVRSKNK